MVKKAAGLVCIGHAATGGPEEVESVVLIPDVVEEATFEEWLNNSASAHARSHFASGYSRAREMKDDWLAKLFFFEKRQGPCASNKRAPP